MNTTYRNFSIFLVLIRRDVKLLSSNLMSIVFDCIPPLVIQVLTFGYLFPLFGMPSHMVAPVYLGSMLSLFLQLGFTLAMKTGFDLKYNRFIDYHMTLPLPKKWLFSAYALNNMIEVAVVTIPLLIVGVLILREHFALASIKWFVAALIYLLILTFFATFFLAISYTLTLHWMLDNVWPRILAPLWWISSVLMIWKKVYVWSPTIAYAMLVSPMTYVAEGMRAAFIGGDQFIPWYICAFMLLFFIGVNCLFLIRGMKKRLDPV